MPADATHSDKTSRPNAAAHGGAKPADEAEAGPASSPCLLSTDARDIDPDYLPDYLHGHLHNQLPDNSRGAK